MFVSTICEIHLHKTYDFEKILLCRLVYNYLVSCQIKIYFIIFIASYEPSFRQSFVLWISLFTRATEKPDFKSYFFLLFCYAFFFILSFLCFLSRFLSFPFFLSFLSLSSIFLCFYLSLFFYIF